MSSNQKDGIYKTIVIAFIGGLYPFIGAIYNRLESIPVLDERTKAHETRIKELENWRNRETSYIIPSDPEQSTQGKHIRKTNKLINHTIRNLGESRDQIVW